MPPHDETSLDDLQGVPADLRKKLKAAGIMTAEQLLGSTAAVGGAAKMAGHLGVAVGAVNRVVEAAEAAIPAAERARLRAPADTSDLGLGAMPPDDEN